MSHPGYIDRGIAGRSARREFERRRNQRVAGAWERGAGGEDTIGRSLDRLRDEGCAVLHDRLVPGSKANIDHIVISPAGVFVVDTKHYRGQVEQHDVGRFLRSDLRLFVAGRDRTKLVHGMARQVAAVRDALAGSAVRVAVPVTATLLFMSAENWSLLQYRPLRFGDVYVLWGKALGRLLRAKTKLSRDEIAEVEGVLAIALPPAT